MKRTIIYSILATLMLFTACRKGDNPKIPTLTRVPLPLLKKDVTADQTISAVTPLAFSGKFSVDVYFPDDVKPAKMDIVVRKNGDNTNVKLFQANVTSYPSTLAVTGAQLISLFGPIVLNDKFDFGANITSQTGVIYEAFPTIGAAYGGGILNEPGSQVIVTFQAVCNYIPTLYQGTFRVLVDEWVDYNVGDAFTVTMIDATHFSFKYLADNPLPIVVTVNPTSNVTSVTKQVYGSGYTPPAWPYGPISAETAIPSTPDDFVAPCDGIFSVKLKHSVSPLGAIFGGPYIFKAKKQ